MYDDEILKPILDSAGGKALQKIRKESSISLEEAIPLLLRGQYNHIAHLDKEITEIKSQLKNMATKNDIKNMATKDDIRQLKWIIGIGFSFITLIIGIIALFK